MTTPITIHEEDIPAIEAQLKMSLERAENALFRVEAEREMKKAISQARVIKHWLNDSTDEEARSRFAEFQKRGGAIKRQLAEFHYPEPCISCQEPTYSDESRPLCVQCEE